MPTPMPLRRRRASMTFERLVTPSTTPERRGPSRRSSRPVTPGTPATPFDYNDDDANAKKRQTAVISEMTPRRHQGGSGSLRIHVSRNGGERRFLSPPPRRLFRCSLTTTAASGNTRKRSPPQHLSTFFRPPCPQPQLPLLPLQVPRPPPHGLTKGALLPIGGGTGVCTTRSYRRPPEKGESESKNGRESSMQMTTAWESMEGRKATAQKTAMVMVITATTRAPEERQTSPVAHPRRPTCSVRRRFLPRRYKLRIWCRRR